MDGRYALADPSSAVAAINMNDEFNFFGKKTYLWGRTFASFPQINDAPVQKVIAVPEPEPVVEEEEGSWWGNLALGTIVTAALGGLAYLALGAATVATGGAALVFVGVCLAGAAVGTGIVTAVAAVQDSDPNRRTRTTSEFVSQLISGAQKGATTAAVLYGLWHTMPAASSMLGGELTMLFSGSVLSTIDFMKLSAGAGYLFTAVQGLIGVSETVSIASGYNWVLESIFCGNIDNYNDVNMLMDGISGSVIAMGLVNYLNRPKAVPGNSFRKNADPLKAALGSGKTSHPEEWNRIIKEMSDNGVEIVYRDGGMAYSPSSGKPGQLIIDESSSYGALLHEYTHYLDDAAKNYPGMSFHFQTKNRVQMELHAYMQEIKLADSLGLKDVANELFENYIRERSLLTDYLRQ